VLVGAGAVLAIGAAGALYMQGRSQIATAGDQTALANAHLAELQTQIEARAVTSGVTPSKTGAAASPEAVAASVASSNIDWLAVEKAVADDSAPLGVVTSGFAGVLSPSGNVVVVGGLAIPGKLTFTATAPGLKVVADWLDIIAADPRFADAWAGGFTIAAQPDGSAAGVQFTMAMSVTDENLVVRSPTPEVKP